MLLQLLLVMNMANCDGYIEEDHATHNRSQRDALKHRRSVIVVIALVPCLPCCCLVHGDNADVGDLLEVQGIQHVLGVRVDLDALQLDCRHLQCARDKSTRQ